MKNMLKKKMRENEGFTLIEIIAVLVILGILSAVAVPKFLDLQDEAKKKTAEALAAAAQSQLSMYYSQEMLNTGSESTAWDNVIANAQTECNRVEKSTFTNPTLTCDGSGSSVEIDASVDGQAAPTRYFNRPTT